VGGGCKTVNLNSGRAFKLPERVIRKNPVAVEKAGGVGLPEIRTLGGTGGGVGRRRG